MGPKTIAFLLFISTAIALSLAAQANNRNALVVLDDMQIRNSHSVFFRRIEESGYKLNFATASDENLELSKYGEYLYDTLILFAPQAEEFRGLFTVDAILNFIDDGHNVLIAGDSEVAGPLEEVALECGVQFVGENSFVIDHFNYDASDIDGDHTLLICEKDQFVNVPIITGALSSPVLFRGTGLSLEKNNPLLIPVLEGISTSYVHSPAKPVADQPALKGKQTALVASLQARNNARVTISGSLELFSDKFFEHEVTRPGSDAVPIKSSNEDFAVNIALWTFGERGQLRLRNVNHHRVGEAETPRLYTIKEPIQFSVDIEQWDGARGSWVAYNGSDVQVEFVMLDPYVRTSLVRQDKSSTFSAQWTVPDVYGIFSFNIEYHKRGYTSLSYREQATVRPLRHNQYERFILSAYPYYFGAFSTMVGFALFSIIFLYHRDSK